MTDAMLKSILNSITVIVDTRENENTHITDSFRKNGVKYVERKLEFGDYSFQLPGKEGPVTYENSIAIERKSGLDELSGNVSQQRDRFEAELSRSRDAGAKLILMVEQQKNEGISPILQKVKKSGALLPDEFRSLADAIEPIGSYKHILGHKYRTNLKERSFTASLFSFGHRYDLDVQFIPKELAGWFIYSQFYYYLRCELKTKE